jgi:hypothetical protein
MGVFQWIRRRIQQRRSFLGPWESHSTIFLKLVRRVEIGGIVIGHYVTNPDERPDFVFRHDCVLGSLTQGDFVTSRWTVTALTTKTVTALTKEEDASLERVPGHHWSQNLIALSDDAGNILMQDYCSADEATHRMAIFERSVGWVEGQRG